MNVLRVILFRSMVLFICVTYMYLVWHVEYGAPMGRSVIFYTVPYRRTFLTISGSNGRYFGLIGSKNVVSIENELCCCCCWINWYFSFNKKLIYCFFPSCNKYWMHLAERNGIKIMLRLRAQNKIRIDFLRPWKILSWKIFGLKLNRLEENV